MRHSMQILHRHTQSALLRTLCERLRRQGRARARPPPPLPLQRARRLRLGQHILGPPELAPHAAHPAIVLVAAEPVAPSDRHHGAAELALPPLAFGLRLAERVLCEVGGGRSGGVGGGLGARDGDVLPQHEARVGEHDEAEVEADGPEGDDDAEAIDALRGEDGGAHATVAGCAGWGGGRGAGGYGITYACGGGADDVDFGDVVLRAREAGRVGDGACAGTGGWCFAGVVLCEDEEPANAEDGGVGDVDEGVEDVEPGEGKAVKG